VVASVESDARVDLVDARDHRGGGVGEHRSGLGDRVDGAVRVAAGAGDQGELQVGEHLERRAPAALDDAHRLVQVGLGIVEVVPLERQHGECQLGLGSPEVAAVEPEPVGRAERRLREPLSFGQLPALHLDLRGEPRHPDLGDHRWLDRARARGLEGGVGTVEVVEPQMRLDDHVGEHLDPGAADRAGS
jgi:hypothetical protein